LGGIENQNRLNYTFNRLISNLATTEHPLVVFLDDLQWIDPASLNLIESLLAVQSTSCFLIIGAYRNNEVGPDHPLMASQERMRDESKQISTITLEDLSPEESNHLLADTLQLAAADCRDLSQALVDKTAGNPLYFRQLLHTLESDRLLRFDTEKRRWMWDDTLGQSLQAGGNVVELMIGKMQALPVETQHTLSMAACLGSQFGTGTLGTITGQPQTDILTALNPALQGGLIVRSNGSFSFTHDRIQEAGYALIPKADLPATHLEIGRLLLTSTTPEEQEEEIFAIVGHLNAGRALIESDSEKTDLAELNLRAGQKAKATAAFADAKQYVEIGLDLFEADSWQGHYELTLSLHNENGELAFLTGQYDQIAPTVDLILENAKSILDQLNIYMTTIEAETAQYNFAKALEIGLDVLKDLGVEIPRQPTPEDFQKLNEKLMNLLTSRPAEKVAELPEMSDETALAASSLLASEMSAAFVINPSLYPIIAHRGSIFTLEFGLNVWSPLFFGNISLLTFSSIGPETSADEASDLILFCRPVYEITHKMLNNPVTARGRTKGLSSVASVSPWMDPIAKANELAQALFRSGFESGDLLYGSYGAFYFAMGGFAAGMNLDVYQDQLADHANSLFRVGQITTPQWLSIYLQAAQNFKETSPEPHKLNGTYFSEDEWLPGALAANDAAGLHILTINKLVLTYHFDIDDKLDKRAGETEDSLAGMVALFSVPLGHFYFALAKLRLLGSNSTMDHPRTITVIDSSLRLMENWSLSVPSTFRHKYDLIAAEKARVLGEAETALSHYEQAIRGARESGFTHEEALANELYARFWAERDNDRFAGQFMREAHSLYRKWGALAKAEHLTKRYPNWLIGRSIVVDQPGTQIISDELTGDLDLLTVLKASQDIASELALDGLLAKLMTNVIENSGAQQGYLILEQDGQWNIVAEAVVDDTETYVTAPKSIAETDLVAQGIVHYVARTQETVVLDDASQSGEFVNDPYIQSQQARSILCTPLINQGKTSGILYLENDLASNVFSHQRVNLLQLLSAQMAISIDNARTHDHLERLLEERSKALDSAEAQVRTLFENSPLGIALTSYDGNVLAANRAILEMLRITEEEALQRNVTEFYRDPGDRAALLSGIPELGFVQDFGVALVRHDGSSFFASLNVSKLVLEDNEVLLAMVEDVTDQITAEQEAATLEERDRLARDLHDSVSQTLYSAGMIADATPRLFDQDRAIGKQNLELLTVMIRGAAAEMRSLLLEFRPDTLRDQTLGKLLETLVVAARAHIPTEVSLKVEGDRQLPIDVTLTLHRIARESLNNVAKHAEASQVVVELTCDPKGVKLRIKDDGRGFDPQAIPGGHHGVRIMGERAQKIGAKSEIDSKPGDGTSVVVTWSEAGGGE
jgi:PAS domain S-box-containing protein